MRISRKIPKIGDTRIIEKFAFWPICIEESNVQEIVWLEKVKIRQRFFSDLDSDGWLNIEFVKDEQNQKV